MHGGRRKKTGHRDATLAALTLAFGLVCRPALAQNDILLPAQNPFGYSVGIAYETDPDGRTSRSIPADLAQIAQYFRPST
jgi:hypothetical protein